MTVLSTERQGDDKRLLPHKLEYDFRVKREGDDNVLIIGGAEVITEQQSMKRSKTDRSFVVEGCFDLLWEDGLESHSSSFFFSF